MLAIICNKVQGVDMGSENSGFYIDVIVAIVNIKVKKGVLIR